MSVGARLFLLSQDLKQKQCNRCGLSYDPENKHCPHCKDLNEIEVAELKENIGIDHSISGIPWKFLLTVGVILLVLAFLKNYQ